VDLTGNNADENANKKKYLEGNPNDPRDLYHNNFKINRFIDADRLSAYMRSQGLDTSWWEGAKIGKNDPGELIMKNDPNKQTSRYEIQVDNSGRKHMVLEKRV
jgi:hypothetical protein